ncbi:hypothetical protein HanXRQr2_Chr15g0722571 [Helianthus annuus]|uniref:Uncharacterized protein n=1 Tax=Helianthus annuus TaxID=4232 RepID=A0A9K3E608_HELAN|nr:hypothetical protein HanXRQr2_Chr15g0722571 [Helianthus annuus]
MMYSISIRIVYFRLRIASIEDEEWMQVCFRLEREREREIIIVFFKFFYK